MPVSDGMKVLLTVNRCSNVTQTESLSGNVRRFYLAAETVEWNYAPSGINKLNGSRLDAYGRYIFYAVAIHIIFETNIPVLHRESICLVSLHVMPSYIV